MKLSSSVIIMVLICVSFLGLVGLLADVRHIYFERKHLSQATDNAALRAITFLPIEQEAYTATLTFLKEAAYPDQNWSEVQVIINAGDVTEQIIGSSKTNNSLIIWIDTSFSRISDAKESINTANAIRLKIRREVPTTFLWLFGIKQISIEDTSQARTISPIMMTVVSDISGSTKIGTLCEHYGREGFNWTDCNEQDSAPALVYETIDDAIRAKLDDATTENLTNIVMGMKRSIAIFSSVSGEYEQSRAKHIILIITDKTPNGIPDDEVEGKACWQGNLRASTNSEDENRKKVAECAIYYAKKAAENGIDIWVISVGNQVDQPLMQQITNNHFWIPATDKLEASLYTIFLSDTGPRVIE